MVRRDNVSFGPGPAYQFVRALLVVAVLVTAVSLFARSWWIADLITNFRPLLVLILTPLVVGTILMKGWKIGLVGLVALGFNLSFVLPDWTAKRPDADAMGPGPTLKLFCANVHRENLRTDEVLALIGKEQPDIAVLCEIDGRWQKEIESLRGTLPNQFVKVRDDNFGIAVLTTDTPLEQEVVTLASVDVPAIRTLLEFGDKRIELWAVHALPPSGKRIHEQRDAQLEALGENVVGAGLGRTEVVAGDLNVSPWSPAFRRLLNVTGLKDSRVGFGIQATWPAMLGSLGIPIDHVLVGPSLTVRERRVTDPVGSDHRPVIVVLGNGTGG